MVENNTLIWSPRRVSGMNYSLKTLLATSFVLFHRVSSHASVQSLTAGDIDPLDKATNQGPQTLQPRIDVHSHFVPPFWRQALLDNGLSKPDGMPKIPDWSEEDHLKLMTDRNITKSIISLSSPGTHLKWDSKNFTAAGDLARKCNDFAADLKKRHPDQFGFFTTLPLPNVQASIVEVERAYAAGADGVGMLTSYHDMYQGDERLAPLYEILNKRKSVVFLHPTTPCNPLPNLPSPILEFYFDTARAVTNLFFTDTVARYPDIVWVLSHGGGALPSMFSRATGFSQMVSGAYKPIEEEYMRQQLNQKFYFDLAGWTFPGQSKFLMDKDGPGIGFDRLVYGSDFPYTGPPRVQMLAERMANATRAWTEIDRENVYIRNAERMLKRG